MWRVSPSYWQPEIHSYLFVSRDWYCVPRSLSLPFFPILGSIKPCAQRTTCRHIKETLLSGICQIAIYPVSEYMRSIHRILPTRQETGNKLQILPFDRLSPIDSLTIEIESHVCRKRSRPHEGGDLPQVHRLVVDLVSTHARMKRATPTLPVSDRVANVSIHARMKRATAWQCSIDCTRPHGHEIANRSSQF